MGSDIPTKQNDGESIGLLRASSGAYAHVKGMATWQTLLAVSSAILGPVVTALDERGAIAGAIYAIFALLLDVVVLEPSAKHYQELGAKIQEVFDVRLFGIPWNNTKVGDRPSPEDVRRLAEELRVPKSLANWYPPEVGEVTMDYARLICQRANMRWDASLRKYYSFYFILVLIVLIPASLSYGILRHWNLTQFVLAAILPLLPAGLKIWREAHKHQESAAASDRAREVLETVWEKAITRGASSSELRDDARRLQDELFDRRKQSPTVPEWFYSAKRGKLEDEMKYGSAEMVRQAQAKAAGVPATSPTTA